MSSATYIRCKCGKEFDDLGKWEKHFLECEIALKAERRKWRKKEML